MIYNAHLSPCGAYRYTLSRIWSKHDPRACFVMLNPSTADAFVDDPTIRRCIRFAEREGCGSIVVVNVYSLRSTDPDALARHPYPHGPDAPRHVADALRWVTGPVICAWGAHPMVTSEQRRSMLDLIRAAGKAPMCLGTTKDGHPRHPLYLPANTPLVPYEPAAGVDLSSNAMRRP